MTLFHLCCSRLSLFLRYSVLRCPEALGPLHQRCFPWRVFFFLLLLPSLQFVFLPASARLPPTKLWQTMLSCSTTSPAPFPTISHLLRRLAGARSPSGSAASPRTPLPTDTGSFALGQGHGQSHVPAGRAGEGQLRELRCKKAPGEIHTVFAGGECH